jgi:hypothetical protein
MAFIETCFFKVENWFQFLEYHDNVDSKLFQAAIKSQDMT